MEAKREVTLGFGVEGESNEPPPAQTHLLPLGRRGAKRPAPNPAVSTPKKLRLGSVAIFSFPRTQGFTCVPSQGGATLGMGMQHNDLRTLSVEEHIEEIQRRQDGDSFLQPLSSKERRVLLHRAGIVIDASEKEACNDIRTSREICGCECKFVCGDDCACRVNGVTCQVDRLSFPCGCRREGCGNPNGRTEFNPLRVRNHLVSTLMRVQLECRNIFLYSHHQLVAINYEEVEESGPPPQPDPPPLHASESLLCLSEMIKRSIASSDELSHISVSGVPA